MRVADTEADAKVPRVGKIRNIAHVVIYSKIIIQVLQEALDYDPIRHHNQPPPDLRIEDPEYLSDIRSLVAELKTFNALLDTTTPRIKEASKSIIDFHKHTNIFLENYCHLLGKGAALLTVGVVASLLHSAGVGDGIIDTLLQKFGK